MKCDVEHKVKKMYVSFGDVVITTINCYECKCESGLGFPDFQSQKTSRPEAKENQKMCFSSTKKCPSPIFKNQKKSLPLLFNFRKKVSALP